MKIALVVGHSILKSGACTSASGFVNEYQYNKKLVPMIAKYVKKVKPSWEVATIIVPERYYSSSKSERTYKFGKINRKKFDRCYEFHLNAATGKAVGVEQCYISDAGKKMANECLNKLSKVFTNRGPQYRPKLYMLNGTDCPSIICETFFCDNKEDCERGEDVDKIARLYAEAITGKTIPDDTKVSNGGTNPHKKYALVDTKKNPLKMRAGKSKLTKLIQIIPSKEKVEVLKTCPHWYKCKYNGQTGWIPAEYLKLL